MDNSIQPDETKQDGTKKKFTPIEHYNGMLHEDFTMYDNPVYTRDLSLFDSNEVMLNRGTVIHFFDYKLGKPKKIGGDIIDAEISSEEDITEDDENRESGLPEENGEEA